MEITDNIQTEKGYGQLNLIEVKITIFWNATPCRLANRQQRFSGLC